MMVTLFSSFSTYPILDDPYLSTISHPSKSPVRNRHISITMTISGLASVWRPHQHTCTERLQRRNSLSLQPVIMTEQPVIMTDGSMSNRNKRAVNRRLYTYNAADRHQPTGGDRLVSSIARCDGGWRG